MQRVLSYEQLTLIIRKYARFGIESRQVAQRLQKLLPEHLKALQQKFAKQSPQSGSHNNRLALGSTEYELHMTEFVEVAYQAHASRIQYETHLMLVEARRSMRAFLNNTRN